MGATSTRCRPRSAPRSMRRRLPLKSSASEDELLDGTLAGFVERRSTTRDARTRETLEHSNCFECVTRVSSRRSTKYVMLRADRIGCALVLFSLQGQGEGSWAQCLASAELACGREISSLTCCL